MQAAPAGHGIPAAERRVRAVASRGDVVEGRRAVRRRQAVDDRVEEADVRQASLGAGFTDQRQEARPLRARDAGAAQNEVLGAEAGVGAACCFAWSSATWALSLATSACMACNCACSSPRS